MRPPSSIGRCPPEQWSRLDSGWYHFSHRLGTFPRAASHCASVGGYVANVTSELEYLELAERIGESDTRTDSLYDLLFCKKVFFD